MIELISRNDAEAAGLKYYFTGEPCRKGHVSQRYVKGGQCRECNKAFNERRRQTHAEEDKKYKSEWLKARRKEPLFLEKERARIAEWRSANVDRVRAKNREWQLNNPERLRETGLRWKRLNREKARASYKAWREANIEKARLGYHNYRARKKANGGKLSPGIAKRLFAAQRGRCACCRKPLGSDYHLDHIIPIALGGQNVDSNIQLLRKECNLMKNSKHPVDFMRMRGYLL